MKQHLILKNFTGSQTGLDFHNFVAGSTVGLSDSLAAHAVPLGWAKPVSEAAEDIRNAPADLAGAVLEAIAETELQPRELAEGEMLEEGDLPEGSPIVSSEPTELAESHETKVTGPAETKPKKPLSKMSKAELVSYALTAYGLELSPDNMNAKQLIEAIENAAK